MVALREQAARARLLCRELSGVGFFCSFEVPPDGPRVDSPADFEIGDMNAELSGLQHGAGFVLLLEGFSFDEPWPDQSGPFTLYSAEPRSLALR